MAARGMDSPEVDARSIEPMALQPWLKKTGNGVAGCAGERWPPTSSV